MLWLDPVLCETELLFTACLRLQFQPEFTVHETSTIWAKMLEHAIQQLLDFMGYKFWLISH